MKYYTYLIGWSKLDKWYYGRRTGNKVLPCKDFWCIYQTSSKHVKNFITEHGEPDIKQIRKLFTNKQACKKWEEKVLRRMNVVRSNIWLNKHNGGPNFDGGITISKGFLGKTHSKEFKEKQSKRYKNKTYEEIYGIEGAKLKKKRISESLKENPPFKGKTHSDVSKKKMTNAKIGKKLWPNGRVFTEDHKSKLHKYSKGNIPWNKGKTHSAATRKIMSEKAKIRCEKKKKEKLNAIVI